MRECEQDFVFLEVVHEPDRLATETLQDFFDLLARAYRWSRWRMVCS
jgi:hypothetical protein